MTVIPFKATEIKSDAVKVTPRTKDGVREDGDLWVRSDLEQVRVRIGGKTYFLYPSDECPADVVEYADDANTMALYHFDQTTGDVIDSSSYKNHGTNIGATRGQAGRFDYAFLFDGVDDRVKFLSADQLNPVNAITIEAHVYAQAQAEMVIIEKASQYRLKTLADNRIGLYLAGIGEFFASKAIPTSKWCHVAAVMGTVSGTERWIKIYIDGEEVYSNMSVWGTLGTTTNPLIIGSNGWESGSFFSGKIDEVRISNIARDPAEFNIPRPQPVAFKDQLLVSDFGGLIIHWNAGRAVIAGSVYQIEGGELTLADNATNFVYVDNTGAVAFNTTGFPDESIPLAKVVTSGGTIQSIEDWRSYFWLHHKKNHSHAEPDIDDVPEANVVFDTVAGHDHDGVNSKAITVEAVEGTTAMRVGQIKQESAIRELGWRVHVANIKIKNNVPNSMLDVFNDTHGIDLLKSLESETTNNVWTTPESTLTTAILSTDTTPLTVSVASVAGFPDPAGTTGKYGVIKVDDEYMRYDSVDAVNNTLNVVDRAIWGTVAADHAVDAPVVCQNSAGNYPRVRLIGGNLNLPSAVSDVWTVEEGRRLDVKAGTLYASGACHPKVYRLPCGSYRMYFVGVGGDGKRRILSAVSADGLAWEVEDGVRIEPKAGTDYSEWTYALDFIPLDDGRYRMYFAGYDGTTFRIFSAISTDGILFEVEDGRRIDVVGASDYASHINVPVVILLPDGRIRMFFAGNDGTNVRVLSAISADGLNFEVEAGRRLDVATGTDYSQRILPISLLNLDDGTYKLFLQGYDGAHWRILSASSSDLINWTVDAGRRLDVATGTDYSVHVANPSVVQLDDGTFRMYFTGYDGTYWRILSALASGTLGSSANIISKSVDAVSTVSKMIMTWDDNIPSGASINYQCSSDDGVNWYDAIKDDWTNLTIAGTKVRLRANFVLGTASRSPALQFYGGIW